MVTSAQIDTITKHYMIALLWTMPGDDDNENPGDSVALSDIPAETWEDARHGVDLRLVRLSRQLEATKGI